MAISARMLIHPLSVMPASTNEITIEADCVATSRRWRFQRST
jgi:hypothetical protein